MKKILYVLLICMLIHTHSWSFDDEPLRWWQAATEGKESAQEISESLYDSIIRQHGSAMGREIVKGMLAETGERLGYLTKTAGERISDFTSRAASYIPQFSFSSMRTFPEFIKSHPIATGTMAVGLTVAGYMARQKLRKNKLFQDKKFFELLNEAISTESDSPHIAQVNLLNFLKPQYKKYIPNAEELIKQFIEHINNKKFDQARAIQFYIIAKICAHRLDEMVNDIGLSSEVNWPEETAKK